MQENNKLQLTTGHMQLPGRGGAHVGSFAYLAGNLTRKRPEAAKAYTGGRWSQSLETLRNNSNL